MEIDDKNLIERIYLFGCVGQIVIVSGIVYFLRRLGYIIDYSTSMGIVCIIVAGCSSALWGSFVSIKYLHISISKLITDFFDFKKSYKYYPVIALFIMIDFSYLLLDGNLIVAASEWYLPILIFLKAIIFGGIEEIGWRYTFQPLLEKKIGFIATTISIFFIWGIWHYLYFYIDGSLNKINVFGFFAGLLTNCFLLGMIYKKSGSLWLCVFTHSLINMLSQISTGGNEYIDYISKIIIIVASSIICLKTNKE